MLAYMRMRDVAQLGSALLSGDTVLSNCPVTVKPSHNKGLEIWVIWVVKLLSVL